MITKLIATKDLASEIADRCYQTVRLTATQQTRRSMPGIYKRTLLQCSLICRLSQQITKSDVQA